MTELIFATHNPNKVKEIRSLLDASGFRVISLEEAGFTREIPEPHDTLEDNASEKSQTIFRLTGKDCFSEDTGLEVEALNGAPGVYSARYAGPQKSAADNIRLLLRNLEGHGDRRARFRTIISLILDGKEHRFEGVCPGHILEAATGEEGFGYDPVFVPEGAERSFAQMTLGEKNRYSHRARAFQKLEAFLAPRPPKGGERVKGER
ncbi:RdgB/HAM1 family non-canonical purine NTP pyrophosphatase [Compostibacter hankyongensis]|uniref:dITP/XTP pyrophosphatase n=1 Tax=Compostibacter hankyongensis TaxID=1007089 RepID=A0ABP8GBG1_9BACT